MNVEEMRELIAAEQWGELESAWGQAVEEGLPLPEMAEVLEAMVQAGQLDAAEMLGWTLLADRAEKLPTQEALEVAQAVVSAVPISTELRTEASQLYRALYGGREHFESILNASGLADEQSPGRAFRTLDTCLPIRSGCHLVNRFDERVMEVRKYNPTRSEFELTDAEGNSVHLAPRLLADEFNLIDESDFRLLQRYRPEELGKMLEEDPAAVLVGLCLSHGGRIDSATLKDHMVPKYVPAEKWGRWWSRARTAAKRSPQLGLEGRNPTVIVHFPHGRSLEQEMAPAAAAAKMPLERLAVLQQYARQARQRKLPVDRAFAGPLVELLAEQARSFQARRPADALAAALAVQAAAELGLPGPERPPPSAAEILASTPRAAQAVARLDDPALWPAALDALERRSDAARQMATLLTQAPSSQVDGVAARLRAAGAGQAVSEATAQALTDPIGHVEVLLWLWRGPDEPPANVPGRVELLSRLLDVLQKLDHDAQIDPADRSRARQRIRSALSADNYASYRRAISEMNEAVAETFKGRVQRTVGLAETVREDMLNILREGFYRLFARAKVEPWLDEETLWTTEAALSRREALLKEIVEVKMLENARAIGAAAEHGDLSENSEYKFALEERDLLRARLAKLQAELARARALRREDVPEDTVGIGSRVLLRRLSDGKELEVTFLGVWDTDLKRNIYSYQTALASEFMGKRIGQAGNVKIEGLEGEYRIERLACGLE